MSYELRNENQGLSGGAIKIIGVILMVFDHLHEMFWAHGAPGWFTWLGRPVLPIFLFMCAEGFCHTCSRKIYSLRLFIGFACMNAANIALSAFMPSENLTLINNVFGTMLLVAVYLFFIETVCEGVREKRPWKAASGILLMLIPIAYAAVFITYLYVLPQSAIIALTFIPNLLATEGGFSAVILGVLFYLFRKKRFAQISILVAFSILSFIAGSESGSVQWMMGFAAVPIFFYNGRRGRGSKYFFYIFYPAHIYLFYVIAWAIER
jgi:hypothetical protein